MRDFEKDFKNWFYKAVPTVTYDIFIHQTTPFSMKWGVYLLFFDEKALEIDEIYDNEIYREFLMANGDGGIKEHRENAQKAALGKAIEIYNKG